MKFSGMIVNLHTCWLAMDWHCSGCSTWYTGVSMISTVPSISLLASHRACYVFFTLQTVDFTETLDDIPLSILPGVRTCLYN